MNLFESFHHIDHGRQQHCVLNLTDLGPHCSNYLVGELHQVEDGIRGFDDCAPVDPLEEDVRVLSQEGVLELHYLLDDVSGQVERRGEERKRVFEGNQQVY